MLKWLHTPSLSAMRAARRNAAVRSMRASSMVYLRAGADLGLMALTSLTSMLFPFSRIVMEF